MFDILKAGLCSVVVVCVLSSSVLPLKMPPFQIQKEEKTKSTLWTRDTLTGNWFDLGDRLEDNGVSIGLGITQIYQYNLHDGKKPGTGAYSGSYDLEIEADMERLAGLEGGKMFMLAEGAWSEGDNLDAESVGGSLFGINDDWGGDRGMDITELWYEQHYYNDRLRIRAGKVDLTGGFECRGRPAAFDGNIRTPDLS